MATAGSKSAPQARGKGPTTVARAYFEAIDNRNLDAATALWDPDGIDHVHGMAELTVPHGIEQFFGEMYSAFPDFELKVVSIAASKESAAVRWRAHGTFDGPGRFQGMNPNGARIEIEGCDMLTIRDGVILENHAYMNATELARQLGAMPPADSPAERAMVGAVNAKTAAAGAIQRLRQR